MGDNKLDKYYSNSDYDTWIDNAEQLNIENVPHIEEVLEDKLGQDIIATVTKIFEAI